MRATQLFGALYLRNNVDVFVGPAFAHDPVVCSLLAAVMGPSTCVLVVAAPGQCIESHVVPEAVDL